MTQEKMKIMRYAELMFHHAQLTTTGKKIVPEEAAELRKIEADLSLTRKQILDAASQIMFEQK